MKLKWSKIKARYYKTIIRKAYLYLKCHKEINACYGYALEEGYASDETYGWLDRTNYWLRCE